MMRTRLLRATEWLFWIYTIVALAGNPFQELDSYNSQLYRPFYATELLLPGVVLAFFIGRDPARVISLMRSRPEIAALFALAPISAFWSSNPQNTVVLSLEVATVYVAAVVMVDRTSLRERAALLSVAAALLLAASAAAAQWRPLLGRAVDGTWRGLFDHKNYLASIACVTAVAAVVVLAEGSVAARGAYGQRAVSRVCRSPLLGVGLAFCAIGLVSLGLAVLLMQKAQGKTAIATAALVISGGAIAAVLSRWSATPRRVVGLGISLSVFAWFVAWFASQDSFSRLWKYDRTFNQRTLIWKALAPYVRERWLSGFGMGAFYTASGGYAVGARRRAGTQAAVVVHAHSGYYEHVLAFGVVGGVLLAVVLTVVVARALMAGVRRQRPIDAWPLAMVVTLMILNLTEPKLLWPTGFHTLLLAVVAMGVPLVRRVQDDVRQPALQKVRRGMVMAFAALVVVAVALGGPGRATAYSKGALVRAFAERNIAIDDRAEEAVNYLAYRLDARSDLQSAFGAQAPIHVRDFLEWAMNRDNGDIVGLEQYRGVYAELIHRWDTR